jgi:hypothetical protein
VQDNTGWHKGQESAACKTKCPAWPAGHVLGLPKDNVTQECATCPRSGLPMCPCPLSQVDTTDTLMPSPPGWSHTTKTPSHQDCSKDVRTFCTSSVWTPCSQICLHNQSPIPLACPVGPRCDDSVSPAILGLLRAYKVPRGASSVTRTCFLRSQRAARPTFDSHQV